MTTLPQSLRPDGDDPRGNPAAYDAAHAPHAAGTANGHATGQSNGHARHGDRHLPALAGHVAPSVSGLGSMPVPSTPISMPAGGGDGNRPGGGAGLTGGDVMRVLRENLWLIVLAAVVSGAAGYGLNKWLEKNHLTYRASGRVLVDEDMGYSPTGEEIVGGNRDTAKLEVRVQTQVAGLTNPQMFEQIVRDSEVVRDSSWLKKEARGSGGSVDAQKAVEAMMESFGASPVKGSRLINVTFNADNSREAADILNVIVNTRIDELRQSAGDDLAFEIRELDLIIEQRKDELEELDSRIRSIRSAGQGGEGGSTLMLLGGEISQLMKTRGEAEGEAEVLRQQLEAARDAITRGADPAGVEQIVSQDMSLARLRQQLEAYEQNLDVSRTRMGENNPQIANLIQTRDALADRLANQEANVRATARSSVVQQLESLLAAREQTAENASERLRRLDDEMLQRTRDEMDLKLLMDDRQTKAAELESNETRLNLLKRMSYVRPSQELRWYVPVTPPGSPTFPRLPVTLAGTLLLGVGAAVGFALLREVLDTSVKSPRDVVRAGQMTVLGTIPDESDDPDASDDKDKPLALTIAHSPHSMTAEQFRMVRGRLAHVAPLESTRTILVTSPQPGDGKTTVACNLAAGLALNGRSVLLVDANFRRPALDKTFGLENPEVGLSTCLGDADRFDECVYEIDSVPNLHVMPVGPRPGNATELVESAGFLDVLDRAFERFDVVVFDSGPILFASETAALAPQVDGVISVVRARSASRGLLGRLRDSLTSLNVEHLGVVLNAVRSRAGGYYTRNIKTYYDYQKPALSRRK